MAGSAARVVVGRVRRYAEHMCVGDAGESIVIVLGHPRYYSRFGFSSALTQYLRSPFSGEAFMAVELVAGALNGVSREVRYHAPYEFPE